MFSIFVITCAFITIQGAPYFHPAIPRGKIVGGRQILIEEIPWQVALEDDEAFLFCGGSIISKNYILTAAHCTRFYSPHRLKIRSGTNYLQNGGIVSNVSEIFYHPDYNWIHKDHDVSIIRLSSPLNMNQYQQPVRLRKKEAVENEIAEISGWGVAEEGSLMRDLLSVEIPIISRLECNLVDNYEVSENMICAGQVGKDSCQGDSGGALIINNAQVGIASWGFGCAQEGYPGVYANIATLAEFITKQANNEAKWV